MNVEDIRKLNILSLEGSSVSSFIPLSQFFQNDSFQENENKEKNESYDSNTSSEKEENEIDFSESDGNNYLNINNMKIKLMKS